MLMPIRHETPIEYALDNKEAGAQKPSIDVNVNSRVEMEQDNDIVDQRHRA
jgi:hypothetical protein